MKNLFTRLKKLENKLTPGLAKILFFEFTDKTNSIELGAGLKVNLNEFGEYDFFENGEIIPSSELEKSVCFIEDVRE